LVQILQHSAQNDPLNLLLRTGSLTVEQIALLRCYCALLWQTYKIATKRTMWKALAYSPHVASKFIEYFDAAFNPALTLSITERKERCAQIEQDYQVSLRKVPDITHDRILKALLVLMRFTVRTNYYRSPETLALKIHSERVEFMPHPRPLFEIFVYSSRIEGTHLRSSKVARGGIRWSERLDDYRSEVLGLVKTQKAKNVIIVPSGAKGGFIVKTTPATGESMGLLVESSYREYITALLSITDNVVDSNSIHPASCVVYDDFDPYFVVAADKGTATFSDTANSIAQDQYSFWLGDAFASGGSQGYDHKKYGITARGGWECVQRHARDIGIDITHAFTTVGIGDMSGDVFGNALILTSSMLLIGAFNHKHIFIDPNPTREDAFKERCRLFSLPRSQWSDFNPAIISHGGGVFDRFEKEIRLSLEIRRALGIGDEVPAAVDGETLISLLLKAPVTLLWNGGIGTYVKARAESHSDVNDGANDAVRVNADELRCKIIGEGGNVGFTQKARIQCAQSGIRINTDAIDNSGGVDLSDHEVNLKLLLSPLVSRGVLSADARNTLLKDIAPDVVESVLQHNRDQSLLLSIADICSVQTLEHYRALIREMHSRGFLDRTRDHLPDEQELDLRASSQRGMCRPELAVCSAAVKMWLKEGLRASELLDDANLERYLLNYFPNRIQSEYQTNILEHSLRRDIISNEIVGEMTLAVGISFLPTTVASAGVSIPHAMKALLAADVILRTNELRSRLRMLDTVQGCAGFIDAWLDLSTALRRAGSWLMHSHPSGSSIQELMQLYGESFSALIPHARSMFSAQELERFESRVSEYQASGVPENDAVILSLLRRVHVVLEILWCAREYRQNVKDVAATLSSVLDSLQLQPLFKFEQTLQVVNKWEQELAEGSFQEIRRELSRITGKLLSRSFATESELHASLTRHKQHHAICEIMSEISEGVRTRRPFTISVLPLIVRHLRELALFTV
jgi:glutamate dehydrogenase